MMGEVPWTMELVWPSRTPEIYQTFLLLSFLRRWPGNLRVAPVRLVAMPLHVRIFALYGFDAVVDSAEGARSQGIIRRPDLFGISPRTATVDLIPHEPEDQKQPD